MSSFSFALLYHWVSLKMAGQLGLEPRTTLLESVMMPISPLASEILG
jgi:hypothetical protein